MCASELDMRDESEFKVDLEGRKVFIRHCHILSLCRDSPPKQKRVGWGGEGGDFTALV
jgi:hypothetical protein